MQSVPSLVGTGTAVAAAAAGLVFGQPVEVEAPWSSPYQGVFPVDYDGFRVQFLSPRPSTSAAAPHRRSPSPLEDFPYVSFRQLADAEPASVTSPVTESPRASPRPVSAAQVSSPKANSRRHSFLRQGDLASRPIAENARDSVSSRDSWIRRFSLRPLSQNGSPRSSMGPDSSSMTFSHGSGVPMLGQQTTPAHPAPNKLVKRTAAGQTQVPGGYQRRGSKSQVLTLRRPATSHQRSATLQQARPLTSLVNEPPASAGAGATFSFGPQSVPASVAPASPTYSSAKRFSGKWTSFFHARRAVSLFRDTSKLPNGQSASHASVFPRKRVSLMPGHISRAYLTKADCITDIPVVIDEEERLPQDWVDGSEIRENSQGSSNSDSPNSTPDQRARRSMSMHFTATSWIARTSSVRRPRRSTIDAKGGNGGRYATDVVGTARAPGSQPPVSPATEQIFTPPNYQRQSLQQLEPEPPKLNDPPRSRKRNTSSLPPLTRLSSFNIDVSRIGLSTPSSAAQPRSFHTPINYMTNSQHPPSLTHSRGPSGERSVTLAGSDLDAHDGGYGDDDETDFRSDAYDSFRTMASSSRVRETPLESMFDESPPSTASNGRTKRLSIQEILGRPWDDETKITEEDESQATPVRSGHLAEPAQFEGRIGKVGNFSYDAQPALALVNRDFGRLSFDDDDDDDWARDDDNTLSNHLSPPSSTNSRRVSPTLRHALRNLGATGSPDPQRDSIGDRPKSSIFDWSEPSIHDKYDSDMPRPKTVHGKQEMDLRIGRSTSRKQPSAAHVRSQSVPVVPDPTDNSKPPPKFGTWGLSSKNVSEDWDDDFDFDEIAVDSTGGKDSATSFMVVPASIQATQPTVKAHSGQIRELSLLVNDLKRLCRHGKELDILHGPTSAKFTEAENIIALASPDEDDAEFGSAKSSIDFDRCRTGNRFIDEGFGGSSLDTIDDPFDIPEPEMTRTTVVRERQSYRRRSVFSPDDDIFGNWPGPEESTRPSRPRTPDSRASPRSSAVIATVIEAMQQQRSTSLSSSNPTKAASVKTQDTKLFFDTNSLQELVKRAGHLRDSLSDAVRRAELITQSPAATPRRERHFRHNPDGSPAFTLVFSDPAAASPPRRLPKSHSTNSVLSRTSVDSPRMQMMIVS